MTPEPNEETLAYARRLLTEALPGLGPSQIALIEQTRHPYWEQAVAHALQTQDWDIADHAEADAKWGDDWNEFKLTPVMGDI